MAKSTLYKIEILNWESYNQKAKKGHPCIMLSKRFLDDAKIQTLPAGGKLLYLGLLLRRGEVDTTFVIASHEDLVRFSGGSGQVVKRLLASLESLQLVTYEPLYIKEYKLKEIKLNEDKVISTEVTKSARASKAGTRGCIFEFDFDPIVKDLFDTCTDAAQKAWLDAYPSIDWIVHEAKKANAWMISNPKKRPKDFQKFFNNWLSKGFESYRKSVPSATKTYAEKIQERNDEVRRQLLEEQQ